MSDDPRLPDTVQSIPEALAFWAERVPEAPAIIVPGTPVITYADLWQRVKMLAASLFNAGIGREDRVVLLLPEGVALTEALLGTMLAGVAVPLPASLTAPELDQALLGLRATAALVAPGIAPTVRDGSARHGVAVRELGESAALETRGGDSSCGARRGAPPWPAARDVALVRQTSGTTGKPKRVPCFQKYLVDHGRGHRDLLGLGSGDRVPIVTPLTMPLGQVVMAHAIVAGAALIIPPPSDFAAAWQAIAREGPTWISTSTGFLELLAGMLEKHPTPVPCPTLRFVLATAAPISPEVCQTLERYLGAPVLPRYGSTEAGVIATTLPPPARAKPGSVGQPVQEVRIVGLEGEDVDPGSEGEIWVRGPSVMPGYLDDPEASAAAFRPGGWYRTGDVGYLDEDGFLFLTGRLNELINRGGEKVAPGEVDGVLHAHPTVAEAATFAVPDARLGEDIVAAVVFREGVTIRAWELRAWMLERLSPAKVPRRFWMVDRLPRTSTGKVQRGVLRERYLDRPAHGSG